MSDHDDLQAALKRTQAAVEEQLEKFLVQTGGPDEQLWDAMRHGCLNGGKRVRPFLVLSASALFGVERSRALRVATALEMVHCYSLVHDDLPAMDDDDLRRGQPTCHVAFDEATAILAGDGLLTLAFEILADEETHEDPSVRLKLISALSRASGPKGMVAGQMIDLLAEDSDLSLPEITRLQRLKTGALINFACEAGAILGKAQAASFTALRNYGNDLGLAFQIADDLLDEEGDEAEAGKKLHKDAERGKATFVSILGIDRAREQAHLLSTQAQSHLKIFDDRSVLLRKLADYVVNRRS